MNTAKFLTETDLNSHVVIFIARCGRYENINKNSIASHLNLVIDTIDTIINVIHKISDEIRLSSEINL